jgi:sprouty-related EVH1 domain-containing protein
MFSRDEYLVLVKAQVMTRDDSKGGWFPTEKGGMSRVGLRKIVLHTPAPIQPSSTGLVSDLRHEYRIFGTQLSDQSHQTVSVAI